MSKDYTPTFFPPNTPVPDPPGAKLIMKTPIFLVGFVLLLYLFYNLYLEAVDWSVLPKREMSPVTESEWFSAHSVSLDPERCHECHDPPLMEETLRILDAFKGHVPEDVPEGYDPDFFDDEKFLAQHGLTLRKDLQHPARSTPGPFSGDQACMKCHPREEFARQHLDHAFEPFENCTMCHNPHHFIAKPLLKETRTTTCTRCHATP